MKVTADTFDLERSLAVAREFEETLIRIGAIVKDVTPPPTTAQVNEAIGGMVAKTSRTVGPTAPY